MLKYVARIKMFQYNYSVTNVSTISNRIGKDKQKGVQHEKSNKYGSSRRIKTDGHRRIKSIHEPWSE